MKQFFVVGNKASLSLSPLIFNYWFKKYKIKAKYFFIEVRKQSFDKTINKQIKNKKIYGFNITTPYKKNIIKYIDVKSAHAENIGAANCVSIEKKIKGTNTDWVGYYNSIKGEKINKNKKIVILGYGGASQAIVYAFRLKGFKNVNVFNRSRKAIVLKNSISYTKKYSLIDGYLASADLIINTTPTNPLNKKQTKIIKQNTIVSDIVYRPKETVFLKNFKENKKIYGIKMLVEQAIPCFQIWFGFKPEADKQLQKKLNNKIK